MEYVISDTHFNHENIFGADGFTDTRRHFTSKEEMNETLIKAWNACVRPGKDTIYFLGDFSLHSKVKADLDILRRLNGHIVVIKGNHDHTKLKKAIQNDEELSQRIEWHDLGTIIKRENRIIHLSHYPMIIGNRGHRVNIHGHIHEMAYQEPNLLNVGVDSPELGGVPFGTPLTIQACVALLDDKQERFDAMGGIYTKHGTIE